MAEWGNGNGIQASVPQDSNGQKLKVRSTSGAYQESDWRLDIEDATTNRKALHVSGWTTLEENGSPGNTALTVKGKSTFDSVNTQQRTEPIVNVQGRTELVNPVNYQTPEDPQLALKVTGRSDFLRFEANDPIAVRIDGITRLRLGQVGDQDNTCGMLRPVLSQGDDIVQPQLQINANPDDRPHPETNDGPHVRMGWNDGGSPSSGHGNVVAIRPRKLLLGLAPFELFYPDGYRIKAKGSTKIEPENAEDVALHVAGKTWTEKLDAPAAGTLQIGAENANLVTIADVDVETQLLGSLVVQQDADLQGNALVRGSLTGQGLITANTLQGSELDVNGPADIAETLVVGGQTTLRSDLSVEHVQGQPPSDISATGSVTAGMVLQGHELSVSSNASVGGDLAVSSELAVGNQTRVSDTAASFNVPTSIAQDTTLQPSLKVRSNNASAAAAAVDIESSAAGNTVALKTVGPTALQATGKATITGDTQITGVLTQNGTLKMGNHDIIMGGSGVTEAKLRYNTSPQTRIEFLIGGTLRFYIDSTGGHSV